MDKSSSCTTVASLSWFCRASQTLRSRNGTNAQLLYFKLVTLPHTYQACPMVFPQVPSFPLPQGSQSMDAGAAHPLTAQDSITLGQLKAIMGPIPKPKVWILDKYVGVGNKNKPSSNLITTSDMRMKITFSTRLTSSTLMPKHPTSLAIWKHGKGHSREVRYYTKRCVVMHNETFISELDWIKSSSSQRRAHVELILEGLEHRDAEIRFINARRLLYILQGISSHLFLSALSVLKLTRYLCGDYISRTSTTLDHRKLQNRTFCEWP